MSSTRDTAGTSRIGVLAIGLLVEKALGWAFREQPVNDVGIDAHAEARTKDGKLSGRLVALQIKAGPSYFGEEVSGGYVYRGDAEHLAYWSRHSLPVIVVLHHPETNVTLWQALSSETVVSTGKGWKVIVPHSNTFDNRAHKEWASIAEGPHYQQRLRTLALSKPWMSLIADEGRRLYLVFEEMINKSSGRGTMKLLSRDDEDNEELVVDWGGVAFPGQVYQAVIHHLFPWADFNIDEDFYEPYDDSIHISETGHFDGGDLVMTSISLTEWRRAQPKIRPYDVLAGELAQFRLEMRINELGSAFLLLDRYLETGKVPIPDVNREMSREYGTGLKSVMQQLGLPRRKD